MKRAAACLLAAAIAGPAHACEGLAVAGAWVRLPPPGSTQAAGYFELTNTSGTTVRVDAVTSPDFDMAMLHESRQVDGRVEMRHLEHIDVAPGARVRAAPGGMHVMLAQPREALDPLRPVHLMLNCEHGEPLAVELEVRRHAPE